MEINLDMEAGVNFVHSSTIYNKPQTSSPDSTDESSSIQIDEQIFKKWEVKLS